MDYAEVDNGCQIKGQVRDELEGGCGNNKGTPVSTSGQQREEVIRLGLVQPCPSQRGLIGSPSQDMPQLLRCVLAGVGNGPSPRAMLTPSSASSSSMLRLLELNDLLRVVLLYFFAGLPGILSFSLPRPLLLLAMQASSRTNAHGELSKSQRQPQTANIKASACYPKPINTGSPRTTRLKFNQA